MKYKLKFIVLLCLFLGLNNAVFAEQEHAHDHPADQEENEQKHSDLDEHGEEQSVSLSSQQIENADITVAELSPRKMDFQLYAPGEIKENGYSSYLVSPRVDSVVLRRHAALGDHVKKGQALVTLFSESVAEAQANFKISYEEWQRVQQLGRKTVAGKRFTSAKSDYEAARARLLAFGLSNNAIQSLIKKSPALGEYTLIALNRGAVLSDDFHQGQRVKAGEELMKLADEKELWVEAKLAPNVQLELPTGTQALVKVADNFYTATVTQEAHTIDPHTRTRIVRMVINNEAHRLHPGLFADVYFSFTSIDDVLAVPESALMRSTDGDWTVFIEHEPDEFEATEVELGRSFGKWREVIGIEAKSRVVMSGAFFVAAEIAKGGFDPHNH